MAGPVHLPLHGVEIIILDFGLPADLCRGSIRDHAELSLDLGKCRFDIEPFLHDILIAENAAHRFSAELVLEQPAVDDVRAHGLSPFCSFQAYSFHAEVGRSPRTAGYSLRSDRTNKQMDDPSYFPGE